MIVSFAKIQIKEFREKNEHLAHIKEFIFDKFSRLISHFQITFISDPVIYVLKSNVIEFYPFLTPSLIDLMPPEFY